MSWGVPNRPKIVSRVENRPNPREGGDGDIQIKGTGLGAKLFAKWSGRWWDVPLSIDGKTKIGVTNSDYLSIDRDSVDIYKNSVKVAEFGQDTTITGGTITIQGTTGTTGHERLVVEDNSISIYANNTEVFDITGDIVTVGSHGTTKIVLDGGDGTLEVGSKFDIDSSGNVQVTDLKLSGVVKLVDGNPNIVIGDDDGNFPAGGVNSILLGKSAGGAMIAGGSYNIGIGYEAGKLVQKADYNILIGREAGEALVGSGSDASNNICIGKEAGGNLTTGSNNVIIGEIEAGSATGDDQLVIASGAGDVTWITGDSSGNVDLKVKSEGVEAGCKIKIFEGTTPAVANTEQITHGITNGTKRIAMINVSIQTDVNPSGGAAAQSFVAPGGTFQDEALETHEYSTHYDDSNIYIYLETSATGLDANQYVCTVWYTGADIY